MFRRRVPMVISELRMFKNRIVALKSQLSTWTLKFEICRRTSSVEETRQKSRFESDRQFANFKRLIYTCSLQRIIII
jgi:hypothetical protein